MKVRFVGTTHREQFVGLPPQAKKAIREALLRLQDGELEGVKAIRGTFDPPLWRIKVGSYRVVYFVDDDAACVLRVFHRSIGYAWLET